MIRAIQHNCARSNAWNIAELETVVDRKADLVPLQEPIRETWRIGISHLAYDNRKQTRIWNVVRQGNGLATDQRTELSRGANDDVMVTDVKGRTEKMTRIINICYRRDILTGESRVRNLNWHRAIRQEGCTIIVGNINAHS